jgi:hypothetical protein
MASKIGTRLLRLGSRFSEALKPPAERLTEYSPPIIGRQVDTDESDWRPISQRSPQDLKPVDQQAMQDRAYYTWTTNPLGHSIIELKVDFVIGDGLTIDAAEEEVQEVLDDFWQEPSNNWPLKIRDKVRELLLYGEQCWPVGVGEQSGQVRLRTIDPRNIVEVVPDPMNVETPIGVIWTVGGDELKKRKSITIVDEDELSSEAMQLRAGYQDGAVFYFAINKVSNATRGISELLPVLDALDLAERLMFNRAEKVEVMSNFFYDVTIDGATDDEVLAFMAGPGGEMPRPGTVQAHNTRQTWRPMHPDLKSDQFETDWKLLMTYIVGTQGFPEHFFGSGGDVNRATALEMGDPTNKRLRATQQTIEGVMEYVLRYVVFAAQKAKRLPAGIDTTFKVSFPELSVRDLEKHAKALQVATTALTQLKLDNVISTEHIQRLIAILAQPFGVELDFTDMQPEEEFVDVNADVVEAYREAVRRAS